MWSGRTSSAPDSPISGSSGEVAEAVLVVSASADDHDTDRQAERGRGVGCGSAPLRSLVACEDRELALAAEVEDRRLALILDHPGVRQVVAGERGGEVVELHVPLGCRGLAPSVTTARES